MTPDEIYSLPTIDTHAWHDADQRLIWEVFGLELHELDCDSARNASEGRLATHLKLSGRMDSSSAAASITAVTLDGKPFGLYVAAGRGQSDHRRFIRTDDAVYQQALGYISTWRELNPYHLAADPGDDVPEISSFFHMKVAKGAAGPCLALDRHVAEDGSLLFDNVAFWRRLEESPVIRSTKDWTHTEAPLSHARVRDAVAEAMRAAIPGNLRSAIVNELGGDEGDEYRHWTAAALATEEGTYLIGMHPWQLHEKGHVWRERIAVERIGGPELFERYAPEVEALRP